LHWESQPNDSRQSAPGSIRLPLGRSSNPDPLNFAHAYVVVAPVIEARGLGVRMTSHALRDLDAPSVRPVVYYPSGAEGVAAIAV